MDPILRALTKEEVTEALGAYVLSKAGIDASNVRTATELSYNTRGGGFICAVRVSVAPPDPKQPDGKQEQQQ